MADNTANEAASDVSRIRRRAWAEGARKEEAIDEPTPPTRLPSTRCKLFSCAFGMGKGKGRCSRGHRPFSLTEDVWRADAAVPIPAAPLIVFPACGSPNIWSSSGPRMAFAGGAIVFPGGGSTSPTKRWPPRSAA